MPQARFYLFRGHSKRSAWVIEDRNSPRAEDPTLYRFSSKAKASRFLLEMIAEHGNAYRAA